MITVKINFDQKALLALQRRAEEAARRAVEAQARQIAAKALEQLPVCSAAYRMLTRDAA